MSKEDLAKLLLRMCHNSGHTDSCPAYDADIYCPMKGKDCFDTTVEDWIFAEIEDVKNISDEEIDEYLQEVENEEKGNG